MTEEVISLKKASLRKVNGFQVSCRCLKGAGSPRYFVILGENEISVWSSGLLRRVVSETCAASQVQTPS